MLLLTRSAGQSVMVGQLLVKISHVSNGAEVVLNNIRLKVGEWHMFGKCRISVQNVQGRFARLGFEADNSINIVRSELL